MRLKHLVRHQARENHKTNKKPLHVDTLFSPKFDWWDGRIHGRWWYCLKLLPPSGIYRSSRIVFGPRLFTEIPFRCFSSLTPPSAAVFSPMENSSIQQKHHAHNVQSTTNTICSFNAFALLGRAHWATVLCPFPEIFVYNYLRFKHLIYTTPWFYACSLEVLALAEPSF